MLNKYSMNALCGPIKIIGYSHNQVLYQVKVIYIKILPIGLDDTQQFTVNRLVLQFVNNTNNYSP